MEYNMKIRVYSPDLELGWLSNESHSEHRQLAVYFTDDDTKFQHPHPYGDNEMDHFLELVDDSPTAEDIKRIFGSGFFVLLGPAVKTLRTIRGLSQLDLKNVISPKLLSEIETGKTISTAKSVNKLADALNYQPLMVIWTHNNIRKRSSQFRS